MAKVIVDKSSYSVIDDDGEIIVPPGKYDFIDNFIYGLARVRTHGKSRRTDDIEGFVDDNWDYVTDKDIVARHIEEIKKDMMDRPEDYSSWGIINEEGIEVIASIYDEIWGFNRPGLFSTTVIKNGEKSRIYLADISSSAPVAPWKRKESSLGFIWSLDHGGDDFYEEDNYWEKLEDDFDSGEYVPEDW